MSEQNLLHPRASSTLELGVRAASTLEWGSEHLRVYGGLTAELVPRPTELFILPQGVVGHAPWLWIGTILGLRLSV
jgi:hypothetical protein